MRKFLSILSALLLCTGLWAATVTYTVDSKTSVSVTGTAPTGASATFSQTYNTAKQLTSGNSMTLTLSGFEGNKITGISLSMRSNAKGGAGSLSVMAGTTEIAAIETAAFNTASWNGAWSTTYVPIEVAMADDAYEIQEDESVEFTIAATANSLYCESFTIEYEEVAATPTTQTIYLTPGVWATDNPKYAIYYANADWSATGWSDFMTLVEGETDVYSATIPLGQSKLIIVRMNPAAETPDWSAKYNQTEDLDVPADNKCLYTISGWGSDKSEGAWSKYPVIPTYYITGNAALVGDEKEWEKDAIEMTDGTYKFTSLPAGDYVLKVTDGVSKWLGYETLDATKSSDFIYDSGDPDHNIEFTVATPNDVTVSYDGKNIVVNGTFAERKTTFTVTVPDGTTACYIAGNFTGWTQVAMTAAGANKFSYEISGDPTDSASYKYCCGPAWKYREINADGDDIDNRGYNAADVVAKWLKLPGATLADTYTSNVTLAADAEGNVSASAGKAKVLGGEYDAIKAGTGSKAGVVVVTVPANVKNLHFHALGWTGKAVKLAVKAGETVLANLDLTSDTGVSGSGSEYNIAGDPEETGYYSVAVNTTEETEVTFTATADYRFLLFGVNTEGTYTPRALNLVPNIWDSADAEEKYAVFAWNETDGSSSWSAFMTGEGDTLTAMVDSKAEKVIFVRFNGAATIPAWDAAEADPKMVWNQTEDLTLSASTKTYTITGWGEGDNAKSVGTWDEFVVLRNCAEINALAEGKSANMAEVTVIYTAGSSAFVVDDSGSAQIYLNGHGLKAGDKVSGIVGKSAPFYGLPQFVPTNKPEDWTVKEGEAPAIPEATKLPADDNLNQIVIFKNVTIAGTLDSENPSITAKWDNKDLNVHKQWSWDYSFNENRIYDITGAIAKHNDTYQLNILRATPVCQDGPYGVKVGAKADTLKYYKDDVIEALGYKQYAVQGVTLKKGDKFLIANLSCNGGWVPTIEDGGAKANFKAEADSIEVLADGEYDFYLKMKAGEDLLYIGQVFPTEYFIAGTMTDWKDNMVKMTAGEGNIFNAELPLKADYYYEFKVVKVVGTDTTWYGNGEAATMIYGNSTGWWLKGSENVGLNTTNEASYKFSFEANENNVISVVIPEGGAVVPATKIEALKGVFSIADNATAQFARGNLQYNFAAKQWFTAEKQYECLGDANLNFGDNNYMGSVDMFGWSCESSNYGLLASNKDADYTGDFKDWGDLFEGGWSTLSKTEWNYLMARKQGDNKLWAMIGLIAEAASADTLIGLAIFPDEWALPAGLSVKYGFYDLDNAADLKANTFTFAQWTEMEKAGAVFLRAAGSRAGHIGNTIGSDGKTETDMKNPKTGWYCWMDNVDWYGYYWLNTTTKAAFADYIILPSSNAEGTQWYAPAVWTREQRRGNSVRLVKKVYDTEYYIAGTMTDWQNNMVKMTAGNGDTMTVAINLDADTYYKFKVVKVIGTDTTWYGNAEEATMTYDNSKGWWLKGDKDLGLQTSKEGEYLFIFEKNENNIISVEMPEPDPVVTKWYIAGAFTDWATEMVELTGEKADSLVAKIELKADTLVDFKLVRVNTQGLKADTAWFGLNEWAKMTADNCTGWWLYQGNGTYNEANVGLEPSKVGEYTFIVNPTHLNDESVLAPVISVVMPEPDPVVTKWYIAGAFTDWATEMVELTGEKADSLVAKIELKADTLVDFKLVRVNTQGLKADTAWFGLNEWAKMTADNCTGWWLYQGNGTYNEANVGLEPSKVGEYTFIVNPTHLNDESVLAPVISVVMPEPDPVVTKWYIAGAFTDWATEMVELTGEKADSLVAKIELKADTTAPFKVVRVNTQGLKADTVWFGMKGDDYMYNGHSTDFWVFENDGENLWLAPTKVGEYSFVLDPTHKDADAIIPLISVVMPEPDPVVTKWYIAGAFTDWATEMVELTGEKADSLVAKIELKADTLVDFKLVRVNTQGLKADTAWFGLNEWAKMTADNCTGWWLYQGNGTYNESNVGLEPSKVGEYTFIVNPTNLNNESVLAPIVTILMPETACNWDKLAWLNSSDPAYAEQFKICVGDPAPGVDIIQLPGFAEQIGIYVTFPSAAFGEMSLKAGQYATQGAGMILYLSAFKMKETEVSIVCENKEYIFTVYNAKGSDEPIDERVKREIVFVPGDVKLADPSMFIMAFGNGKEAYSTVMDVKKVEDDTIYVAQIPEELDSLIFVRAAHGLTAWKDLQWGDGGNVWNQTPNQKIACDTATFSAWDNYYFNVTWCPEAEEPIVSNWYIAGDFTTWATGMVELKGEDAKALSANINILQSDPENPYQNFKVVRVNVQGEKKDTMWFGIGDWAALTEENNKITVYPSVGEYNQANVGLQMTKDGDYTFTVDVTNKSGEDILAPVVTVEMPSTAACNWDKLAWLNSSDPAYAEQFKICVGDPAPGVDIIQLPGFADEIGIYVTFPSAAFGEMSLNSGQYATQGAGMILYLSAFKMKETEVSIVCENKEYIFTVYNAKGSDEPIDERVKREIVFVPGDVKLADPSMFVMAFGSGKEAYSTVMDVKKVEDDTIYVAQIPEELDSLIFVRAAHGLTAWKDLQWGDGGNVWNQTPNQKIACDTATFSAWDNYYFNVTWCEEPVVPAKFYICGSSEILGNWQAENAIAVMTDSYTIEDMPAGSYSLKVLTAPDWQHANYGYSDLTGTIPAGVTQSDQNNISFTLAETGNVTISFKMNGDQIETFTIAGVFSTEAPKGFYVTGNEALMGEGNAWNPAKAVYTEETTYTFKNLAAGDYSLKVLTVQDWAGALGYSELTAQPEGVTSDVDNNINFTLAEAGDVTITYSNDNDNMVFTIAGNFYVAQPVTAWYIAGTFTDWATGMVELKGEDAKALSAKIAIAQTEQDGLWHHFKLVRVITTGTQVDAMWFGIQEWAAITSNNLSMTVYPSVDEYNQANVGLQMTKDGDYTFTVDVTAMTTDNVLAPVVTVAMPQPDPVVSQYGLLINGETFVEAVVNPANEQELMATGVSLVAGQTFVLHDKANNASWTISNFNEGSYIFGIENNAYVVTETALYDFYVYPNYDNSYIYVSKQEQTDVDNVVDGEQLRKVIENGTLYIYRDGKKYSVQGYRVY